jgi:hypothetical protein
LGYWNTAAMPIGSGYAPLRLGNETSTPLVGGSFGGD